VQFGHSVDGLVERFQRHSRTWVAASAVLCSILEQLLCPLTSGRALAALPNCRPLLCPDFGRDARERRCRGQICAAPGETGDGAAGQTTPLDSGLRLHANQSNL
jgi:hypothetical protein